MADRWVVNASPLIVLAKISHLHLLTQLTSEIAIPQVVVDEVNAGPPDDPARMFLAASPLPVVSVSAEPAILAWDLGAGETAVLSHALANPGWRVVIDDVLPAAVPGPWLFPSLALWALSFVPARLA